MFRNIKILTLLLLIFSGNSRAENDTINYRQRRLVFISTTSVLYTASMTALAKTWYSKYEHSSFHWFNDNNEWLQMDKVGHSITAWKVNTVLYEGFNYAGYSRNKSVILSFISSNIAMAGIELFDGFSAKWGASYGDIISNLAGSSLYSAQKMWLQETWLIPKFSFHRTPYAELYPEAFGTSFPENCLKDYNGQTYWLALPLKRIHNSAPEWLCLSFGYGAEEMIDATSDNHLHLPSFNNYARYRQYYISMDINLRGIKTKSTFLRTCFNAINIIRIPLPALELSRGRLKGHLLYF